MTWIHRLKSLIHYFLAVKLRELVRYHTASAFGRLDDRLLADIGVARHRIADYAREVAHKAVSVPPMPTVGRGNVLARIRSSNRRRVAIRELLALDDRLLRDIGIEPGQVGDVVDAMLSRRRDLSAAHQMVQLSGDIQEILVPAHRQIVISTAPPTAPDILVRAENCVTTDADWTPDISALHERAANESWPSEWRSRASAEL